MIRVRKNCEDCGGHGCKWEHLPPDAPDSLRFARDTESGKYWVVCDTCKGKGWIPTEIDASLTTSSGTTTHTEGGPTFCDICCEWPARITPKGKRCHTHELLDMAADNPVPLPDGQKCLEDLASIGVPGAAEKLALKYPVAHPTPKP